MPLAFHKNRDAMFEQQYRTARDYIIPFLKSRLQDETPVVLDIGCGDGGVLKAFAETGCRGIGVDLNRARVEYATKTLEADGFGSRVAVVSSDIHNDRISTEWEARFDLVILKDVIEHVPQKERLMERIRSFLKPEGLVFFGFPPWRMPYGGHQQIAKSKLGKTPYLHLLPKGVYLFILKRLGEDKETLRELAEIHDTRISIAGFERLVANAGFEIVAERHYLFNPIYKFKFGLEPRLQYPLIRSIPVVRDFLTTACYYLVKPGQPTR